MGKGFIATLCLLVLAAPAARSEDARSLRGQWQTTILGRPAFSGMALIDAERRVHWDAINSVGVPRSRGYIARGDGSMAEIILTDGVKVDHWHCAIQSSELLHCRVLRPDGSLGAATVIFERVGPGPKTLMSERP